MKRLAIAAIVLATIAIGGEIFIFATRGTRNDDETLRQAIRTEYRVYAPPMPDTLSFCGEQVPLNIYYVRESLDRELLSNMYWQSNMLLWLKRAGRCFPVIEPILKRNGVPDDFKYLCVIESGLVNATSPAKAQGYWQFLKSTGERFGLEISDEIDMRNDLEASTEAACRYLKLLHDHFGSWTAAAAAYNCGEGGLQRRLTLESADNYYDVRLNRETARYVYRILAIKLIFQNPQDFGYTLRRCDLYPVLPYREVELSGQDVDLYAFARQNDCSYKMLREMNPWITAERLKNKGRKRYTLRLPVKKGTEYNTIVQGRKDTSVVTHL
ncbi:MAG: lytic transglycosylase domain-containing protein [Bacteroidales bacterium]|nr:lytic transglycosylase domain-containing protein [Bacteroidales bacterium]